MKLNKASLILLGTAVIGSGAANAQFFDKLKDKAAQAINSKAKEEKQSVSEQAQNAAVSATTPELGEPSEELRSFTSCIGINIENVMVGNLGDYTFKKGFSNEERSGFINRRPGEVKHGCILPSLQTREVLYFEVDESAYKAEGGTWEMQCVKSANPGAGAIDEVRDQYPSNPNYLSDSHMFLHCGHGESNVENCAEGSNSDRASAYSSDLKKRGKTALSFFAAPGFNAPKTGEKLYCQYYNSKVGKSLFAFEYLRVKGH
ncbi:hypothetical protein DRW07_04335 [Alteromonas sediminis]|uniref:Uncharacterized protein n=1 Tax=Alteromonas sediminis TaxID=2259342 RepID=A0A3N5Y5Y1_9ALTE|nr:hypothetical protein [Alteromonas sediminis]RPJ68636.1 hypothetical protein DRW07_04335 [Alteromonas sediminis]